MILKSWGLNKQTKFSISIQTFTEQFSVAGIMIGSVGWDDIGFQGARRVTKVIQGRGWV